MDNHDTNVPRNTTDAEPASGLARERRTSTDWATKPTRDHQPLFAPCQSSFSKPLTTVFQSDS